MKLPNLPAWVIAIIYMCLMFGITMMVSCATKRPKAVIHGTGQIAYSDSGQIRLEDNTAFHPIIEHSEIKKLDVTENESITITGTDNSAVLKAAIEAASDTPTSLISNECYFDALVNAIEYDGEYVYETDSSGNRDTLPSWQELYKTKLPNGDTIICELTGVGYTNPPTYLGKHYNCQHDLMRFRRMEIFGRAKKNDTICISRDQLESMIRQVQEIRELIKQAQSVP